MDKDIILTVDYDDRASVIRKLDCGSGCEQVLTEIPTTAESLNQVVDQARREVGRLGRVTWIQESTTGWARIQELLDERVEFTLANVLHMPLPPKARRRKTDKVHTARMQREYLAGNLPLAHQPAASWRQLRRLVAYREHLVSRRTAVRNWIDRYLAHETWFDRIFLWSPKGQVRLRTLVRDLPRTDGLVIEQRLEELRRLEEQWGVALSELVLAYNDSAEAKRIDAILGIDVISGISIVARVGPVERFRNADALIALAGLAPGIQESDQTRRNGQIGGGGTDRHLRHYLIEATVWARKIPRYQGTYERVKKRRGSKVGRLVIARMLVRSIYKILKKRGSSGTSARPSDTGASRYSIMN